MIKLLNQFEQVDNDTPFARNELGKISDYISISNGSLTVIHSKADLRA